MSMRYKQRLRGNKTVAAFVQDRITALVDAGVVKTVADDDVRVVVAPEEEAEKDEVEVEAGAKAKPKAKGKANRKSGPKSVAGAKAKTKAKGKAKRKTGPKSVLFEKCSWDEVSTRQKALTLVRRLQLTANDFHAH